MESPLPAGKFEFPDMGIYIGEWQENKAMGLGLMTRENGQGEYTGLWHDGKESCGVFLWPNTPSAMYQGDWSHYKRQGYGVFHKDNCQLMGEFQNDCLSYGVFYRVDSGIRFEGEFQDNLPLLGLETYPDGGIYGGEYENAKRQGYGKRISITNRQMAARPSVLLSTPLCDRKIPSIEGGAIITTPEGGDSQFPGGFVLSGEKSNLLLKDLRNTSRSAVSRRRSKSQSIGRGLSSYSSKKTPIPDSSLPTNVQESYSGQWLEDKRHGYGVCSRTDGVTYEGQWQANSRHGYGMTRFPDDTVETGRYERGKLVHLCGTENPLLFIYTHAMAKQVERAIRRARAAQFVADNKFEQCQNKKSFIRNAIQRARSAASLASKYSLATRALVKELFPDFEQPGLEILESAVKLMTLSERRNAEFELALLSAREVLEEALVPSSSAASVTAAAAATTSSHDIQSRLSRHGSCRSSFRNNRNIANTSDSMRVSMTSNLSTSMMDSDLLTPQLSGMNRKNTKNLFNEATFSSRQGKNVLNSPVFF